MSTEPNPAAPPAEPTADLHADTPQTPEGLMQAATQRIAALEAERDDMKDRWMRAEAEMANVRARAKRDVDETRQFAMQKFARDVAEAAENLRRGLQSVPPPGPGEPALVAKLREGFEGIERSFLALLERNGIVATDPTGAAFDPNLHQAMAEQETTEHPPGTVIQTWSLAWTLNGRLLRPAMVVVAKHPTAELGAPKLDTTA
ncbi:MAG: nucleotide exchange factor GrpE [Acetobacteraceae bacterium]|nr:nucleotide exchange factor GrpE [Acetobacteraceae bacterium]